MRHQTRWDDVESSIKSIVNQLADCNKYVLSYDLALIIDDVKKKAEFLEKQLFPFIEKKRILRIDIRERLRKIRNTPEGKIRQNEINRKSAMKKKKEKALLENQILDIETT